MSNNGLRIEVNTQIHFEIITYVSIIRSRWPDETFPNQTCRGQYKVVKSSS